MSKKNFTGGLNSLLGDNDTHQETEPKIEITEEYLASQKRKGGRPKTQNWRITKSSEEKTKQDETRATFIVKKELLPKLKAIAYWERAMIKDVIHTALTDFITNYENENGAIKPAPNK